MCLWHSSLRGLPAQSLQLRCLGRDALAQTGSEVESSWQLHLPACSCWHAHLSLDLELPKQDVIEANSFAGHLLPLGFFPSLFFEKGKRLPRTANVKCIWWFTEVCLFSWTVANKTSYYKKHVVINDQFGKFFSVCTEICFKLDCWNTLMQKHLKQKQTSGLIYNILECID